MNVMTDPAAARVLLIKAKGGLGNRMLSAVTGLIWADLAGRVPVIDWRDGVYAPAGQNAYPLLFDSPAMLTPEALEDSAGVVPDFWRGRLDLQPDRLVEELEGGRHGDGRLYRKYSIELERLDQPEPLAVFWSYLPKMARLRRHLRRHPGFAGKSRDRIISDYLGRYFRPNARVRAESQAILGGLTRPVIGVHVRYTDRKMPLAPVMARIRRQRARMPGAALFVATDSAFVEAALRDAFGDIQVTPKYLPEDGQRLHRTRAVPYDKQREAENAMIDMWVLAGCDHLIYSKNSTFSLASALIGGLGRDRQTDIDGANPGIVVKRLIQPYL